MCVCVHVHGLGCVFQCMVHVYVCLYLNSSTAKGHFCQLVTESSDLWNEYDCPAVLCRTVTQCFSFSLAASQLYVRRLHF